LYRRYFELQNQAADSGLFDILAHPDLIRCFGFAPDFNLNEQYKTLCQKVKAQGMLLEMNGAKGPGLHPDFLAVAKACGVQFSAGSDAHCPEDVGKNLPAIYRRLAVG
jgi:histidinol-phosphatase (PHP family)